MGRPATGWRTLGIREFIRTPFPAASTTTVTLPRVSGDAGRLGPEGPFPRMERLAPILPQPYLTTISQPGRPGWGTNQPDLARAAIRRGGGIAVYPPSSRRLS